MKDFFKRFTKQEPDDLDTGYDSDYYGGAYGRQPVPNRPRDVVGEQDDSRYDNGYDDRYERDLYNRDRSPYEEERDTYRETTYARPVSTPVVEELEEEEGPVNAGTLYYTPETYRDCREAIVSGLTESHVVVVNMKNLETADTVRLFDYIMGAVLALDADMTRLNQSTILLAPNGVEVTEDDLRSLFSSKAPVVDTAEDAVEKDEMSEDDFIGYDELSDEDMSI